MTRVFIPKRTNRTSKKKLLKAVKLCLNHGLSIRKAAQTKAIPFSTLKRYVNNLKKGIFVDFETSTHNRQIFTKAQEAELHSYLTESSNMCFGLSTQDFRKLAYELAERNNMKYPKSWDETHMAGKDWMEGFMKRNGGLSLRKPEHCSLGRAMCFNEANVSTFFNNLDAIFKRNPRLLNPARIFNLDEIGTTTVPGNTQKVFAPTNTKQVSQITSAERGILCTTCCIINAAGHYLPPAMIFPRVNFVKHMLKNGIPNTLGLAEKSGWMTQPKFVQVMEHFITHSHSSKSNPSLLIMDNHESHISLDAVRLAKKNGVTILTIPPHTSHKLQPLDVAVYSSFRGVYDRVLKTMIAQLGCPLTIYEVAEAVCKTCDVKLSSGNIRSGFSATGIFPFNRDIFPKSAFFSAKFSDRPNPETNKENKSNEKAPAVLPSSSAIANTAAKVSSVPAPHSSVVPALSESQPSSSKGSPLAFPTSSPTDVQPFPKAKPRNLTQKQRRVGKSMIATDTPEKDIIEARQLEKEEKIRLAQEKKSAKKRLFPAGSKKPQKKKSSLPRKKKHLGKPTTKQVGDQMDIDDTPSKPDLCNFAVDSNTVLKVDDYVLVFCAVKKDYFYYVGKIQKCYADGDFEVNYLRKCLKNGKFYFPQVEDIASVSLNYIKFVLPPPVEKDKLTIRQKSFLDFDVDMNRLTVR